MPKLTGKHAKQEIFCQEYIKDLKFNGTQAVIRAGYSDNGADVQAVRLLATARVQERIAELMKKRNERNKIDADYVLNRLREIDELDVMDILQEDMKNFKLLSEWPKAWRTSISGIDLLTLSNSEGQDMSSIIKKIKWPDKTRNLELLGKHIGVNAFSENLNIKQTSVTELLLDIKDSSGLPDHND